MHIQIYFFFLKSFGATELECERFNVSSEQT